MYHTFHSDVSEFGLFKTGGRQNYHEPLRDKRQQ